MKISFGRVAGFLVVGLAVAGCADDKWNEENDEGVAIDDDAVAEELKLIGPGSGPRCSIKGEPPVTTGCSEEEVCVPYVCTHSIPPTCAGTCQVVEEAKPRRCDVTGDPPVTTGCEAYETCALEACTNAIPPHCWGHCE